MNHNKIRAAIKDSGKTQREVAKEVGVDETKISQYCNRDQDVRGTMLAKIAKATGVKMEDLM